MEPSCDNNIVSPPSPKRMRRRQSFRDAWLQEANFASWLDKSEDPYTARCKVCERNFIARRSMLETHVMSEVHKRNMALRKTEERREENSAETSCKNILKIKQAEIRYCVAIVEHNISFNSLNHFLAMNKVALPDSNILRGITLRRSKISAIIRNVLNKYVKITTTSLLHNKFFSILIDESTEVTEAKGLCILVRYIHENKIQTYLLDYIRIGKGKGEDLFQYCLQSLEKHNLSVDNIVGISVDNTNVMLGSPNSLVTRLLEMNKEVAVFQRTCHAMHLVASPACECMKEKFLQALQFLKPAIALYSSKHEDYIEHILNKFPSKFEKEAVINEWHLLPTHFSPQEKKSYLNLDILGFWDKVSKIKDLNECPIYKNIYKVAEICLSLPHSSADIEKLFSLITEIKTRDRNRLTPETVCALTRIKLDLNNKSQTCITYEIPRDMLELFNKNMYEKPIIQENLQSSLVEVTDASDSDS